jgi:ankyrin repeat protein
VSVNANYLEGDAYYDIARNSSALHVAAWRARPEAVKELIACGASVNAIDADGRTALQLAVKACVDSYWTDRRSPDSVRVLLEAGASAEESSFQPATTRSTSCWGAGYLGSGEARPDNLCAWPSGGGAHEWTRFEFSSALGQRASRIAYNGAVVRNPSQGQTSNCRFPGMVRPRR